MIFRAVKLTAQIIHATKTSSAPLSSAFAEWISRVFCVINWLVMDVVRIVLSSEAVIMF